MAKSKPTKAAGVPKERPILFSAEMVIALLDGRKTMTRRIVKGEQPEVVGRNAAGELDNSVPREMPDWAKESLIEKCRYGKVGDRLWVRESFWLRNHGNTFKGLGIDYKAGGHESLTKKPAKCPKLCKWHPSIHMPRWASRILLEITGVKVERLQDISEEDAIAEGMGVRLLRDLLGEAIGKFDPPNPHWSHADGGLVYCYECGKKAEGEELEGGWSGEEDSPPRCETCGKLLDYTLTDDGTMNEYQGFLEHGIGSSGEGAYQAMRMIHGGGNPLLSESCGDFHFNPELKGGLAKICFRYLWDRINGKGSWKENPWTWALSFRVLKGGLTCNQRHNP